MHILLATKGHILKQISTYLRFSKVKPKVYGSVIPEGKHLQDFTTLHPLIFNEVFICSFYEKSCYPDNTK